MSGLGVSVVNLLYCVTGSVSQTSSVGMVRLKVLTSNSVWKPEVRKMRPTEKFELQDLERIPILEAVTCCLIDVGHKDNPEQIR